VGFADEMQDFDEQFEADKDAGTLPDGTYSPAAVTMARIERQDDGQVNMMWQFEAEYDVNGTTTSGTIRKWWNDLANPENDQGRKFLAKDMKRVGYEGRLSELEAACESEQFIGLHVEIAVKTKAGETRDYTNVYINRLAPGSPTAGGEPAAVGAGKSMADDDIPF
jgi:hypothetical protein